MPLAICRRLEAIFCDIDDTLTHEGKLQAPAFAALWRARSAGLKVVPVTGRPAGWVDHIARMWPVDAVIGENGAFIFYMEQGKMERIFVQSKEERAANRDKLAEIRRAILQRIPEAAISADQGYRETDLAIDFCEDIAPLSEDKIQAIVDTFQEFGAQAKISSIHVNGWFGKFDKFSTLKILVQELWQDNFATNKDQFIFVGDSPNDEPMFQNFTQSVGVANIHRFRAQFNFLPTYITSHEGGEGFAEVVDYILKHKFE